MLALLLSVLQADAVTFYGDSMYVIGLINCLYLSQDIFLYNSVSLMRDILRGSSVHYNAEWIPRL